MELCRRAQDKIGRSICQKVRFNFADRRAPRRPAARGRGIRFLSGSLVVRIRRTPYRTVLCFTKKVSRIVFVYYTEAVGCLSIYEVRENQRRRRRR